jgi:hypothetical protein
MAEQERTNGSRVSSLLDKYSTFVHDNATIVKFLESCIANAAYYMPSRFDGSTEELSEVQIQDNHIRQSPHAKWPITI